MVNITKENINIYEEYCEIITSTKRYVYNTECKIKELICLIGGGFISLFIPCLLLNYNLYLFSILAAFVFVRLTIYTSLKVLNKENLKCFKKDNPDLNLEVSVSDLKKEINEYYKVLEETKKEEINQELSNTSKITILEKEKEFYLNIDKENKKKPYVKIK